jgi:hypothetical protein
LKTCGFWRIHVDFLFHVSCVSKLLFVHPLGWKSLPVLFMVLPCETPSLLKTQSLPPLTEEKIISYNTNNTVQAGAIFGLGAIRVTFTLQTSLLCRPKAPLCPNDLCSPWAWQISTHCTDASVHAHRCGKYPSLRAI